MATPTPVSPLLRLLPEANAPPATVPHAAPIRKTFLTPPCPCSPPGGPGGGGAGSLSPPGWEYPHHRDWQVHTPGPCSRRGEWFTLSQARGSPPVSVCHQVPLTLAPKWVEMPSVLHPHGQYLGPRQLRLSLDSPHSAQDLRGLPAAAELVSQPLRAPLTLPSSNKATTSHPGASPGSTCVLRPQTAPPRFSEWPSTPQLTRDLSRAAAVTLIAPTLECPPKPLLVSPLRPWALGHGSVCRLLPRLVHGWGGSDG